MNSFDDLVNLLKIYNVENVKLVFQLTTSKSDLDYYQWYEFLGLEGRYNDGYYVQALRWTYPKIEFDDDWCTGEEVEISLDQIGRIHYMTGDMGIQDLIEQNIFV